MFRRLSPWLFTVSMSSIGCSAATKAEPEWPHQPSPSYPQNSSGGAAVGPGVGSQPDPAVEKQEPSASNLLAKQYESKTALDTLEGKATYYADSLAGNHTANGDVYDPAEFTAAHKKLPFGTIVRVVRQDGRATTYVKINDRGPFGPADRIIDLSKAAAKALNMMQAGVVDVRVEVVELPAKK
jgi:rare lipoprotein A